MNEYPKKMRRTDGEVVTVLGEDNAEVVIACSVCNGAGLLGRLVPLSREAG